MRRLSIVLLLTLFVGLFAACTASQPAAPTTAPTKAPSSSAPGAAPTAAAPASAAPTTAAAAATTPIAKPAAVPTGEVSIAVPSLFNQGFDPQIGTWNEQMVYGFAIFDPLIGATPDGKLAPGIAEKWEVSADGKDWTFSIRKGVKFHDGSDLTGADVKFSLDRGMAPEALGPEALAFRDVISNVELKDPFTVIVHLKKPQGEVWNGIAASTGKLTAIVPKKYIEDKGVEYFREHPIGSGPFKFVNKVSGVSIQLEAVGNWRGMPKVKTVKVMGVREEATAVAMLKTGQVDMVQISPDQVSSVKDAGLRVFNYAAGQQIATGLYYDVANAKQYPLGDKRVRQALSLAINRDEMAKTLFSGFATPSAVFSALPNLYYYDSNVLKPDPYDLEQAKKLLAEAGHANGFSLKLYSVPWTPWMNTLNQALAGYWIKAGIKTELVPIEYTGFKPLMDKQSATGIWGNATTWQLLGVSTFDLRKSYYSTGYHKNHANAQLDDLINKTEATMDQAERKKLALQAAVEARNEYAHLTLVEVDSIWGIGKKVAGWTPVKGMLAPALNYETITLAQ